MKEYLAIGELASIFKVTVQLLRHYDEMGLLIPEIREADTGRRRYRFDQMYKLATIRYLRKLGYSLERIREFLRIENVQEAISALKDQSELIRKQYFELLLTENIIQKKLHFIKTESEKIILNQTIMKEIPERYFVLIGEETSLFTNELFYFYPTIGFYMNKHKEFGAYLIDAPDAITYSLMADCSKKSLIPAGKYACRYHRGPYRTILESIDLLCLSVVPELDSKRHTVVTINVIDQFIESHPENYVTELQLYISE